MQDGLRLLDSGQTSADQIIFVGMMVCARLRVWRHYEMVSSLIVEELMDSPTEAASTILVNGFEHEKDRTDFEDCGANECRDATASQDLVSEFG